MKGKASTLDRLLAPGAPDEETRVRARTLNLLALVVALMALLYSLVTTLATPGQASPGAVIGLGAAPVLGLLCYALSKKGRVHLAAYLLFIGLFGAISFYATDSGNKAADLLLIPSLYLLVSLPAGYILRPAASFLATTLAALYFCGLLFLFPPPAYTAFADKTSFWSNVILAFAIAYVLAAAGWVFSRGLGRILDRTRRQNRQLQQLTEELAAQRRLQAETGQRILDLADRLAKASARQASGSNRQAAAVAQVSTSIGELEQAARQIAQDARRVDEAAQETLENAQAGQEIVWRNNEAMGFIRANAQEGVREAAELDKHLTQVGQVAAIMGKIASQIQLVAFNATLEAAEAGASGQRFGVVAAEIKDLAADSLKQARQVTQIVRQLQEAGEEVVRLSNEQVGVVEAGAEAMVRSSAAHQAIIASAERLARLSSQIQQATAQQQQASEQVAGSIQEIQAVADRWVVSSYQMDEMVTSLQSLAEQMA